MNLAFPAEPIAQAIGWALIHLLWQGAVVAAVLGLALASLSGRSANLRYALSCAALLLIVALGVVTAVRSYPTAASRPSVAVAAAEIGSTIEPGLVAGITGAPVAPAFARPDWIRSLVRAANDRLPAIVTVWLAGVALFSVRLILHWLRARRLVTRSASPASHRWQDCARRLSLALGVRQVVRLIESAAVEVPSVIGILRPAILLPATTLSGLTPAQIEMILAHELAHIRRQDFLVNLLQAVVETLLFYHPAVWWISQRVRIERENCCDDLAIAVCGDRLLYARALTRLEELRAPALALAASANGGSLLERIRRIVGVGGAPTPGNSVRAIRGAAAFAMLSCVLLALAAPSLPTVGAWPSLLQTGRDLAWAGGKAIAERVTESVVRDESTIRDSAAREALDAAELQSPSTLAEEGAASAEAAAEDASNADPDLTLESETEADPAPDDERPTLDELIAMRVHHVTPERIREMRSLFPGIRIAEIAGMSAVGATPEFVREMRRIGLGVRSAADAQGLAALGVTAPWVRAMRATGLAVESARDAQGMKAVGVTPELVDDLRAAGLAVETAEEAQGLAALGVTGAFVETMRSTGLEVESAKDAQGLRAVGVTPELIRSLRATGIEIRSAQDAQGLAAVGVTSELVRSLRSEGLEIRTAQEAQGLAAVGVTARLVRDLRRAGLEVSTASEAQGLAALGVTGDFVRAMRDAGVEIQEASEAQSLKALNITPDFVQRLARAGYRDLSVQDLTRLGAAGVTGDFIRSMSKYKTRESQ